jgi:hypothetical protein
MLLWQRSDPLWRAGQIDAQTGLRAPKPARLDETTTAFRPQRYPGWLRLNPQAAMPPNTLPTETRTDAAAVYARLSLAPATLRAYRADWADFVEWCRVVGRVALPAARRRSPQMEPRSVGTRATISVAGFS